MVESIWSGMPRSSRLKTTRATLPMSVLVAASAWTMLAMVTAW